MSLQLVEATLRPQGSFATPLKGDTLFGHLCWQLIDDPGLLGGSDFQALIKRYGRQPFAVVSSAWPVSDRGYLLRRPDVPLSRLVQEDGGTRDRLMGYKRAKALHWMEVAHDLMIDFSNPKLCNDWGSPADHEGDHSHSRLEGKVPDSHGGSSIRREDVRSHNTINRITGTTGEAPFAPFTSRVFYYRPGTELALFTALDESVLSLDNFESALTRIGSFGFGADASTGCGRFDVIRVKRRAFPRLDGADCAYALSPLVPEREGWSKIYHKVFVRYGRHGHRLAHSANPFKNPILMADEGAVLIPHPGRTLDRPYIGRALTDGISKVEPRTVHQGYALYLPARWKEAA